MKPHRSFVFLTTYVLALIIFVWGGFYFYQDYNLRTQIQRNQQSGRIQTDLAYVDLPRISVTLSPDTQNHSGNVRMDITLEIENKYMAKIESAKPKIMDRLIHYTQTLSYSELSRPRSTVWLRPDFLQIINNTTDPTPVHDIIFREFVVL